MLLRASFLRFSQRRLSASCETPRLSRALTRSRQPVSLRTHPTRYLRNFTMSSKGFSNTSTGDAPADPYKAKNKDEPSLEEKIETLNNFVSSCKFGMMTTMNAATKLLVSRCMAVAAKEGGGIDLLFHTNTESGKTDDLADDPAINMSFLNPTGEWASFSGSSKILTDRETVKKYYSPQLKTWLGDLGDGKHDGGPDDPRIGVIKVEAKTITYAAARGNFVSRGVDMVQGALTGSAAQVNKLREISEDECKQWRESHQ